MATPETAARSSTAKTIREKKDRIIFVFFSSPGDFIDSRQFFVG
jgi:hypothetical protein